MKSKMTIGRKLMLSFGALLAVVAGMSFGWISTSSKARYLSDRTADNTAVKIRLSGEINTAESDMFASQQGRVLYAFAKDKARIDKIREQFAEDTAIALKAIDAMENLVELSESKRILANMRSEIATWRQAFSEIEQLCDAGQMEQAVKVSDERVLPLYTSIGNEASRLGDIMKSLLEIDQTEAVSQANLSTWWSIGMIIVSLGVGGIALYIVRQTSSSLRSVANDMGQSSTQVASAAAQVSSSSQELAQGATEQAASLEETSASTEEMSSMTRRNADNSRSAASLMQETAKHVGAANDKLEGMLTSMNEINASSEKISKIIKVIDEIAFQTNILALNAAVEAARAGEAGMGFAVVADEVRNLAQRCAQAAKDTTALIEESINKASEGSQRVAQVVDAIAKVTENADKVKSLIEEVSVASEEQASGIAQVAKTLTEMEKVTQRGAANAEEGAAASEELSAQSAAMRKVADRLGEMVGGADVAPAASAPATHASHQPASHPATAHAAPLRTLGKAVGGSKTSPFTAPEPVRVAAGKKSSDIPMDDGFTAF